MFAARGSGNGVLEALVIFKGLGLHIDSVVLHIGAREIVLCNIRLFELESWTAILL